jgi:hypothetical protein
MQSLETSSWLVLIPALNFEFESLAADATQSKAKPKTPKSTHGAQNRP